MVNKTFFKCVYVPCVCVRVCVSEYCVCCVCLEGICLSFCKVIIMEYLAKQHVSDSFVHYTYNEWHYKTDQISIQPLNNGDCKLPLTSCFMCWLMFVPTVFCVGSIKLITTYKYWELSIKIRSSDWYMLCIKQYWVYQMLLYKKETVFVCLYM